MTTKLNFQFVAGGVFRVDRPEFDITPTDDLAQQFQQALGNTLAIELDRPGVDMDIRVDVKCSESAGPLVLPDGSEPEREKKKRLYLAGPMRGIPEFNFPAFDEATEDLRAAGYDVFSPAEHDRQQGVPIEELDVRECMASDVGWICRHADGIALLPGWDRSFGAKAEVALAQAIGIPHNFVRTWITEREPVKV